ncbi:hypothetical protein EYF80_058485 [Liparis tanakae]|uniref:Uncharacterized protein n=1 Tax=Liparis tanakae TaxID=230148 RepID=A0A4Z2ERF9_9TELE|nr:hypothetical protein EYF80_058485 [Liparis tanakae]
MKMTDDEELVVGIFHHPDLHHPSDGGREEEWAESQHAASGAPPDPTAAEADSGCSFEPRFSLSLRTRVHLRPPKEAEAVQYRPDYSWERDTDPIAKSNKKRRISLQMFSLDMMAPSITIPHVRDRGVGMTRSESHRRGTIHIGLFHSSASVVCSPPVPSVPPVPPVPSVPRILGEVSLFSEASLPFSRSRRFLSPSFFFFCLDNRNVQSFFNGARNYISSGLAQYCCPLGRQTRCLLKKKIAVCFSVSVFTLLLAVKRRVRSDKLNNKLKDIDIAE